MQAFSLLANPEQQLAPAHRQPRIIGPNGQCPRRQFVQLLTLVEGLIQCLTATVQVQANVDVFTLADASGLGGKLNLFIAIDA